MMNKKAVAEVLTYLVFILLVVLMLLFIIFSSIVSFKAPDKAEASYPIISENELLLQSEEFKEKKFLMIDAVAIARQNFQKPTEEKIVDLQDIRTALKKMLDEKNDCYILYFGKTDLIKGYKIAGTQIVEEYRTEKYNVHEIPIEISGQKQIIYHYFGPCPRKDKNEQ